MRNVAACLMVALLGWSAGCKPASAPALARAQRIDLLFTYGSEKEDWIKAVTTDFNREGATTASGKIIQVEAIPMGSGECIDTLLGGQVQAHLTSPASAAFIKLGNAQSRVKTGKDLIGATENLVLSPVVIAMWKPMAEALGWGRNPIGWAEILGVAHTRKAGPALAIPNGAASVSAIPAHCIATAV